MAAKTLFQYPFEWLDEIICKDLNPERRSHKEINPAQLADLRQQLRSETGSIWKNLKSRTFLLLSHKKIMTMLEQYQESLDDLRRQALVNMAAYPEDDPLNGFCGQVLTELDQLQNQFRRRYANYLSSPPRSVITQSPRSSGEQPALFKITCRLSVDQIAIILKASDDTRLLAARSFSLVLRSITPYLSTERMPDFSWKSARSSTMKIEERDKQVTIQALEQLIKKIRDY